MVEKKLPRSAEVERQCFEPNHEHLSLSRQCQLLDLAWSSWYYEPLGESPENLSLMREIDRQHIKRPFAPKRSTSRPAPGHKVYPYLRRGLAITRPDQIWASDITYIPLQHGFLYLTAVFTN
jgi:putative transposase